MTVEKIRILFLCTGNSCRSQMAEGLCRHLRGGVFAPQSAGTETHGLNPRAVQVLSEIGIDISRHHSKTLQDLDGSTFDVVVTVCDRAREACPVFPGATCVVPRSFDDPPALAQGASTEEEELAPYRRVRDEIRRFIETLPASLSDFDSLR